MKKKLLIIIVLLLVLLFGFKTKPEKKAEKRLVWNFQSIDTMKYSRDLAREKLKSESFSLEIEKQVKDIAKTGATHIAIATPYDEEFVPFLKKWVEASRKNGLKIWFRGNFSGWEGWFEYPKITRQEHIAKTRSFILKHHDLFLNGDVFSSCPECENGGPGDPRNTGDIKGHRNFLIEEYRVSKQAFKAIEKNVASNYLSMNGDVARAVMDRDTTRKLDGIVTIDHYVKSPERLLFDIEEIHNLSGGKIILGEFGAPIPDIHGKMSEDEQAKWLKDAFSKLMENPNVIGVNYWANIGSSTSLWNDDLSPRKAVKIVTQIYKTRVEVK